MLIILSANSSLLIGLAYYLISHPSIHPSVFFLLASFFQITSHFSGFLGEVPGYTSDMTTGRHNDAGEEKLKPSRADAVILCLITGHGVGINIQIFVLITVEKTQMCAARLCL